MRDLPNFYPNESFGQTGAPDLLDPPFHDEAETPDATQRRLADEDEEKATSLDEVLEETPPEADTTDGGGEGKPPEPPTFEGSEGAEDEPDDNSRGAEREVITERRLDTFTDVLQAADGVSSKIQSLYDISANLPGMDKNAFNDAMQEVENATTQEIITTWKDTLRAQLSPKDWEAFTPQLIQLDQAAKEYNQLDNPHNRMIVREEAERRRSQVVGATDWDKLVGDYLSLPASNDDYLPKDSLRHVTQSLKGKDDLLDLLNNTDQVQNLHDQLAERGLLRKQPLPEHELAESMWGDFAGVSKEWNRINQEAINLISPLRQTGMRDSLDETNLKMSRLAKLAEASGLHGAEAPPDALIPKVIGEAFSRHLGNTISEFDHKDKLMKEILEQGTSTEKGRPNMLFVNGAHHLTENTDIEDPHRWINEQIRQLPSEFRQGLGRVLITDQPLPKANVYSGRWDGKEYNTDENTPDHEGEFLPTHNTIRLDVSFAHKRATELYPDSIAMQKNSARMRLENVFRHELIHKVHNYDLSVAQLRDFIVASEQEPAEISGYVEDVRQAVAKGKKPYFVALREELCESGASYLASSSDFFLKAPLHVKFLNEIFGHYTEDSLRFMQVVSKAPIPDEDKEDALRKEMLHAFRRRIIEERISEHRPQ